jgi:hypothetical protein
MMAFGLCTNEMNQNLFMRFRKSVVDSGGMLEHMRGFSFAIKGLPVRSNVTSYGLDPLC